MRFYKLTGTEGGPLPPHDHLRVGAIIRVRSTRSRLPGAQWNAETGNWVSPIWTECADPLDAPARDYAAGSAR